MKSKSVTGSSPKKPKVVLVLQGGGALGAYHIGAYQALEEAGFRPDWVSYQRRVNHSIKSIYIKKIPS
jgi:hypothetical protein